MFLLTFIQPTIRTMKKTKVCSKCGVERDIVEFHRDRTAKDGHKYTCRICKGLPPKSNIPLEMKRCSQCGNIKSFAEFYRNSSHPDGYQSACKRCEYTQAKKYREANKEKIRQKQKDYWAQNKERLSLAKKEYRSKNKERLRLKQREYVEKNKDKVRVYQREYRLKHSQTKQKEILPEGTKRCSKCKQIKDKSEFYRSKNKKSGVASRCKECSLADYRKKHPPQKKEILPPNQKRCSKCEIVKSKSEFGKSKLGREGLRASCKQCDIEHRKKKYYEKHPERIPPELIPDGKKQCKICNKVKNIEEFPKNGLRCSACYSAMRKAQRETNKADYKRALELGLLEKKTKRCSKCGELLPLSNFPHDYGNLGGISGMCRLCKRMNRSAYYRKNKEKLLAAWERYRPKDYQKKYYQKVKVKKAKYNLEWRQANSRYDSYAHLLTPDERPIEDKKGFLQVLCTYCGRYFYPSNTSVQVRVQALVGKTDGENRLYCSSNCKNACPTYRRVDFPKGFKETSSREVQAELRQIRLALDEYECQKCGKNIDQIQLHCHHITGVVQNPIESADLDNCITLCKKCHKWAHTLAGCSYFELRCK